METYPLIYTGPKAEKRQPLAGSLASAVFKIGPLSEQPGPLFGQKYALVTEDQRDAMLRVAGGLYRKPEYLPPPTREEFDALAARVAALECDDKPKGKRPKADPQPEG